MKIDILGKGRMPRTGLLLPAYDVEVASLSELKKYAYLKFLKVYVHGTNVQITSNNYVELFKVATAAPIVDTTPVVKKEKKKKAEPVEQVAEPVTEKELEPVATAPVEEPKEAVEVNENEEATLESEDKGIEDYDDASDVETTEPATEEKTYSSKKKKNRK
jgi:uncharacterized membrane-anchored protein